MNVIFKFVKIFSCFLIYNIYLENRFVVYLSYPY